MKKIKRIVYIVLGVLGAILLTWLFIVWKQANDHQASIYKYGRIWDYNVYVTDSSDVIVDTFSVTLSTHRPSLFERIMGKIVLSYNYERGKADLGGKRVGVTDNDGEINVVSPDYVTLGYTALLPKFSFSKKINKNSWKNEQHTGESRSVNVPSYFDKKQQKEIKVDGKTIKYAMQISDTMTINYHNKALFCYVLEGKNTSHIEELGQFRSQYFYNEQYGIVKWIYYTPWQEITTISLRNTNF